MKIDTSFLSTINEKNECKTQFFLPDERDSLINFY
jgi:hypothetical protein